jgi:hypothetical protein
MGFGALGVVPFFQVSNYYRSEKGPGGGFGENCANETHPRASAKVEDFVTGKAHFEGVAFL